MEAMQLELIDQNKAEVKGYIFCLSALYPRGDNLKEHPLQVFKATSDPYTIYLHEAMKELDQKDFISAMAK